MTSQNTCSATKELYLKRVWAMPNQNTFQIPVIRRWIDSYILDETEILDPFCGESVIGKYRNDMKISGIDSLDWLPQFEDCSMPIILFDPPYSPRQLKECYKNVGVHLSDTTSGYWAKLRSELKRICVPGGMVLSFGWNSVGIGIKRGFIKTDGQVVSYFEEFEPLNPGLCVSHGGNHNDTICIVERKIITPTPEAQSSNPVAKECIGRYDDCASDDGCECVAYCIMAANNFRRTPTPEAQP